MDFSKFFQKILKKYLHFTLVLIREYKINALSDLIRSNKEQLNLIGKINLELKQMKHGSIALVNQITTISKMRIYDPKID